MLRLLQPFDVKLHYLDRPRLPEAVEQELNLTWHTSLASLTRACDVVTLNCPLHPEAEHMINARTLQDFKRGAYLINTARGKLCERDAVVRAVESGQLAGYAGDVWFPQPARAAMARIVTAGAGVFLAFAAIGWLASSSGVPLMLGSFGATGVLLFAAPGGPFSQPRQIIGGHLLATLCGLLFQERRRWPQSRRDPASTAPGRGPS